MELETPPATPAPIESYPVRFTGSGGTYFRVWIVNVLLTILTVGLYTPFARRRSLKYFYSHTTVAGSPLEFTGSMRRMFFGFLLFFGFFLAYTIASRTNQEITAGVLTLVAMAFTPYLWASAQRFRMASTRWRGISGRFNATWRNAYAASWPILAFVGAGFAFGFLAGVTGGPRGSPGLFFTLLFAMLLGTLLAFVRLEFNYSRLRVERGEFGGQPGRWKPRFRDFLKIAAAALGLFIVLYFGGAVLAVLLLAGIGSLAGLGSGHAGVAQQVLATLAIIAILLVSASPALAYREARKFALIWNNIGLSHVARFESSLKPWSYVGLRVRNVVLTLLTLGFFRPFAVTSEKRMKAESVTLHVRGGLDQLAGRLANQQGAFADALADAVGFDFAG